MSKNKSKKISSIRQKELKRVKQAIKRLEKKGYTISSEYSDLLKLSTQKLKTITPKKLRSSASGWWLGEKVSGKELYKKQRDELKLKRKLKKQGLIFESAFNENVYESGEDVEELKADVILKRLYELCAEYDNDATEYIRGNAKVLRDLLDKEIKTYGKKAVAISAEENANMNMETGEKIIFASTQEQLDENVQMLIDNIRGYIPNESESELDSEYRALLQNIYNGIEGEIYNE